ncbi:FxsB family radical SAM/SPASM domain protein [Nonomuraea sp. FMUSA5-5]|uniref:FxsB family radical SAM/SPASM domain protein n=1 Tax=Nonomuraea composti TaxID=2720023 RepID=A0ABX1AX95_9ACTN|nr:FxsB family cyclophane-forming radical SAM/SPASM peptide maturase [Nonomuraea sp. FMUSA5-5]NJP88955.1 FxsB family radical SAM/SPASM domain protein [Nonomuraea sp. FMUSA5-5]
MLSADDGTEDHATEWPLRGLDVANLRRSGWASTPFRQFILKVHGRCNLSCQYCYIYAMADRSWSDKPAAMSAAVAGQAVRRIADHVSKHGLERIEVVFHGGEPLLSGPAPLVRIQGALQELLPAHVTVDYTLQTNGVLLPAALNVLAEHGFRIGVSIDGTARTHDRNRVYANGRGSHDQVRQALTRLREERYRHLFAGLLCVVDLDADPMLTYAALLEFEPPAIDFLLPLGNWEHPPPRPVAPDSGTAYGSWLVPIFERWYDAPRRETRIRLFEEIINMILGGGSTVETVGLSPVGLVVIDTDGSIEQVDTLKSAFPGAPQTTLNVLEHDLDLALEHPAVAARQIGELALSDVCKACPIHHVCGAGYYPHRYRPGSGFRNPSVYCADLGHLIRHIATRVIRDLATLRSSQV